MQNLKTKQNKNVFVCSAIPTSKVSIVSYGILMSPSCQTAQDALMSQDFKVVIVDESHYMKNRKTKTSKFLVPLLKKAQHKLLLTGTPVLSRPAEVEIILRNCHFPEANELTELFSNVRSVLQKNKQEKEPAESWDSAAKFFEKQLQNMQVTNFRTLQLQVFPSCFSCSHSWMRSRKVCSETSGTLRQDTVTQDGCAWD